jgi:hypothetical protein
MGPRSLQSLRFFYYKMVDLFKSIVGSVCCCGELSEGAHYRGVPTTRVGNLSSSLICTYITTKNYKTSLITLPRYNEYKGKENRKTS